MIMGKCPIREASTSELFFEIAAMHFRLRSEVALRLRHTWRTFLCPSVTLPDFSYLLTATPVLPEPDGQHVCRYFDATIGEDYAISSESGREMRIFRRLPCADPLSIDDLYPQLALPHVLLRHGRRLVLHASYLRTAHGALLFTAPSGTGKSTQARLWRQHRNALIVNGDRAVLGFSDDRPTAFGYPCNGSSEECLALNTPVWAVVALRQAPKNAVRRLTGAEAVRCLLNGSYLPPEHRDDLPLAFELAASLAESVPIFELSCVPDASAVETLEAALSVIEEDS